MIEAPLLVGLVFCVAAAAALSTAEVAVIRVRRTQVVAAAAAGDQRSRALLGLLDDLSVVVNCVLLLVLLVQVGAATISGYLAARWFGGVGVTIASVLVTGVLFVYAEALPKTRAVREPLALALRVTPLLRSIVVVLRPAVAGLLRFADLQSVGDSRGEAATEAELRLLAREAADVGEIEHSDAQLVERSFEFGDLRAADVMVPRDEIRSIASTASVKDAFQCAVDSGHRRLPVTKRDLDDVVGFVRMRDAAVMMGASAASEVSEITTPVLRCPPHMPIRELLSEMQKSDRWLSLVSDRDGRTLGLVTIEDIVAELVGEIADDRAVSVIVVRTR